MTASARRGDRQTLNTHVSDASMAVNTSDFIDLARDLEDKDVDLILSDDGDGGITHPPQVSQDCGSTRRSRIDHIPQPDLDALPDGERKRAQLDFKRAKNEVTQTEVHGSLAQRLS